MSRFVIEDQLHAEPMGEFRKREEAIAELRQLAEIPWDQQPNQAPCTNWRNCGRIYEVVEFEVDAGHWKELNRWPAFEISAQGVRWEPDLPGSPEN